MRVSEIPTQCTEMKILQCLCQVLHPKTGYNFEFKEGKYILQPSMMMSYTYVNTFDYTNAAGVGISSDPLHTLQLHPNIKFAANLKNGCSLMHLQVWYGTL